MLVPAKSWKANIIKMYHLDLGLTLLPKILALFLMKAFTNVHSVEAEL